MKFNIVATLLVAASLAQAASVSIRVDSDSGRIPISTGLYGRNGSGVTVNPSEPAKDADLFLPKEAGLRFARENAGNNCTKYNWRKKLSSHPDWYNNVYAQSWDFSAQETQTKLPDVQAMYGFQLLGWVASNTNNNFNDYAYNQSQWWAGVGQDLAGGGTPNTTGGSVPAVWGDASKYLEPWPADSSTGILKHWFGAGGMGLDSNRFRYWSMDNEIEIWDGTHNDVNPRLTGHLLTAEEAVQRWAAVAKAARKHFPGIKLVGPASPSE
ncbi:MAG: glycoside hydrolase family 44 protein, partial [Fibrobacterota bacterium]